ncbi:MAG: Porin [Pedosphaera sp.]|nr:Porin [Pedosphaera sp.]
MKKSHLRKLGLLGVLAAICLHSYGAEPTTSDAAKLPSGEVPPVAAEESQSKLMRFMTRDYLLGDWGSLRSRLSTNGVDFEFFYIGSVPSNLSGGLKRGSVYEGLLAMTLDVDTEKLGLYEGGHFHAGGLYLQGHRFSPNYVGDLNQVNLVDFPNAFRLWELYYEHKFCNTNVSFKLGELSVDQDFIVADYSKTFVNQTFFYPTLAFDIFDVKGFPSQSHGLPSTPYTAPGARLRWDPTPMNYVQAAVYGGNPDTTYSGTQFRWNEDEGVLAYFETGFRLNQQKEDTGLPGTYKAGGYYHTGKFVDVNQATAGAINSAIGLPAAAPHVYSGNYGFYLLAEQQLYREVKGEDPAKQGLGAFFRVTAAPKDRNLTDLGIDGGFVYKGLIPTRDYDSFGVAVSYLRISDDIRQAQRNAIAAFGLPIPVADYEAVVEVTYKAQVTAWWTLQPSVQRVWHPGGHLTSAIPDATVFILQTTLRF